MPAAPMGSASDEGENYQWKAPAGWVASNGSSMRIASFSLPGKKSSSQETADLSVIVLSGDGGGQVANINRWREQLKLQELDEKSIKQTVRTVKTSLGRGNFSFLKNPASQQGMLVGTITHHDQTMFIKAIGPLTTLEHQEKNFLDFMEGIHVD